ncbi:hypothetical protein M0R04_14705 [Candidatus Dojkabacteria bacterium]|jgi:hypothetical protein|nr:hypothetical protein [Candidatus Dojkabacteria bacterium]
MTVREKLIKDIKKELELERYPKSFWDKWGTHAENADYLKAKLKGFEEGKAQARKEFVEMIDSYTKRHCESVRGWEQANMENISFLEEIDNFIKRLKKQLEEHLPCSHELKIRNLEPINFIKALETHPATKFCEDDECIYCGYRDCPHHEPLHYHHDGCPACITEEAK